MTQLDIFAMQDAKEQRVYSFGYQGKALEPFVERVIELDALVIDTRIKPWARDPAWMKSNLAKTLGDRYLHVPEFGNVNYKGGPIEIVDLKAGIAKVQQLPKRNLVFICVCRDHDKCHRSVVLQELCAELTLEMRHLR